MESFNNKKSVCAEFASRCHFLSYLSLPVRLTEGLIRCLTVRNARPSFPIQPNPIQHPYCPPERLRLHMRLNLRRQPGVGVSRQLLHRERIGSAVQ